MGRQSKGTAAKAKPPKAATQPEPTMYVNWTRDTVSVADAVAQHRNKRYNSADLIARVEGTIDFCVRLRAIQANAVPIRLYTHATSETGKRWGKSLSRKRLASLRNPQVVGKSAGYAEGADEIVEVEWHPAMDLLANPNHHMSGQEYDLLLWDHELTGGTAFEYVETRGQPVALLPLYAAYVTPQPSQTELVSGYWYYRGTPAEAFYKAEDVDALRLYPDRSNPYMGRSPLRGILKQADLAATMVVEALSRMYNDCRPDHAWVSELPMTPDQQKEAEQRLAKFRGPRNKGKPVVVGQLKPIPLQFNYRDMERPELEEGVHRQIRNAYQIPESIADLNDANLASAQTGLRAFQLLAVQPDVRMRAEQRTDQLLPRFGVRPGEMWFAPDNACAEDEEQQSRVLVSLTGGVNPILSVNEARRELGYEDVEWGDRPQLGGVIGGDPIDTEITETTDPLALPAGAGGSVDAAAPVQDTALNGAQVTALAALMESVVAGRLPVDAAIAAARMSFPAVPEETISATFEPLRNFKPTPEPTPEAPNAGNPPNGQGDESEPEPQAEDAEPVEGEAGGAKAIGEILTASGFWFNEGHGDGCQCAEHKSLDPDGNLFAILREWYEEWGPAMAEAPSSQLAAMAADARRQLATILRPELARLYADGVFEVMARAGQEAPETLSEAATRAVDTYVSRLSGSVTETVVTDVREAIGRSIAEGMNGTEATRAVADAMGVQADWRAERVARTETARATEYGRLQGLDEVGVKRKQWLLSSAPCQFCETAVATLRTRAPEGVPVNEPFFRAGETIVGTAGGVMVLDQDVMVPSDLHPNDACALGGVWNV